MAAWYCLQCEISFFAVLSVALALCNFSCSCSYEYVDAQAMDFLAELEECGLDKHGGCDMLLWLCWRGGKGAGNSSANQPSTRHVGKHTVYTHSAAPPFSLSALVTLLSLPSFIYHQVMPT